MNCYLTSSKGNQYYMYNHDKKNKFILQTTNQHVLCR